MTKTLELRQKRAALIADARKLLEERADNGVLGAEDQANWDRMMSDADELRGRYEQIERLEAAEADLAGTLGGEPGHDPLDGEARSEMPQWESRGMRGVQEHDLQSGAWRRLLQTTAPAYRNGFARWLATGQEFRSLQSDSDEAGGYLVSPMQVVDRLIKAMDNQVFIRQWATVFAVPNAQSLGAPSLDSDPSDADWTTELATGSEDTAMDFGRRELHPHPLAKRIKVSRKLLRQVPNSEGLVIDRLGYKFGITFEKAALTGNGAGQPLGVFTASAQGISTGRDVATDNAATAVTFDGLINAKYTLKQGYWASAKWLAHSDFFKQVSKLKAAVDGDYLWRPSVRDGEPDRLLDIPVTMSAYAPNTFTSGQYVAVLGDFSHYWIADSMAMDFQRLNELYAEANQVGLIGRLESDGMPVLEEAFVRVKLG